MEKRYKINTSPASPPESSIRKHMDFDALLEKHKQSSAQKSTNVRRLYFGIATAAAVALLLLIPLWERLNPGYDQMADDHFANQPFINPPLEGVQKDFVSKTVDSQSGGSIDLSDHLEVQIPKAAFVNQTGEAVQGPVEIKYREFQDFVDFFISGIPMHYDSLDQRYLLESAGMVEVFAEQNGARLQVAPGKSLSVRVQGKVRVEASN
ncbi:MAG: hypothetical protein HKN16_03330, partial [Saprospiraceae bacterium]|nr:hypothetical protein [Saprospiraceae bacterium]